MCVCRLLHLCAHICEPFLHFHNIEKIYIYMSLILQNYLLRCKCISNLPVPISCITFINYFTTASHSLQFFFFQLDVFFWKSVYLFLLKFLLFVSKERKNTSSHVHLFVYIYFCVWLFAMFFINEYVQSFCFCRISSSMYSWGRLTAWWKMRDNNHWCQDDSQFPFGLVFQCTVYIAST